MVYSIINLLNGDSFDWDLLGLPQKNPERHEVVLSSQAFHRSGSADVELPLAMPGVIEVPSTEKINGWLNKNDGDRRGHISQYIAYPIYIIR